ncbi:MAG TPA: hypothetical protein GXZ89_05555 [Fastidiosipila sp.]|nr:hypothetical protein [Fastidiosipila sp.]
MSPFLYIWRRSLWNFIKQLPKKPGRFILVLFYAAFFILALVSVSFIQREAAVPLMEQAHGFEIYSLVWLAIAFLIGTSILFFGATKGSAVFSGPDVHFLFTAPYRPQSILIYGLVGMLKAMAIVAVFLPFQFPNLSRLGFSIGKLFLLILLLIVMMICFNLGSMVLYLIAQNKPHVRSMIRGLLIAIPLAFIAVFLFLFMKNGSFGHTLQLFSESTVVRLFPLFGWTMSIGQGIAAGFDTIGIISLVLLVLTIPVTFYLVYLIPADFYEDAITQVEKVKEQQARMQGKRQTKASKLQLKHKGHSGLNRGHGLSAIFFRNWREMRRKQPYFVGIPTFAILFVTGSIVFGFTQAEGADSFGIFLIFIILLLQLFVKGDSFATTEMKRPLIYTLPYAPHQKLFWLTLTEVVFSIPAVLPSIILYVAVLRPVWYQLASALAVVLTFPVLTAASTMLTYRMMGSIEGQLDGIVQMFTNMILILPTFGLLVTAFVRFMTYDADPSILFILAAVVQTLIGSVVIYLAGKSALEQGLVKS